MNTAALLDANSKPTGFHVGQRVRSRVQMLNDQGECLGFELCAAAGTILVVSAIYSGRPNCIEVSHEGIGNRTFGAAPHELEVM